MDYDWLTAGRRALRSADRIRPRVGAVRGAGAAMGISGLALIGWTGMSAASAAPAAHNSSQSNAGDVWLDSVSQPAGPGHEMDPHLPCEDINLWGNGLADSSGGFTIDGWNPSGTGAGDQAWEGTNASPVTAAWSYDAQKGGDQVIAVINVKDLIAHATANGDAPVNSQGFHFKLQFTQDPQKHKVFWVDCSSTTTSTTSSTKTSSTKTETSTETSTSSKTSTETTTSTETEPSTSTSTSTSTPSTTSTETEPTTSTSTKTSTQSTTSTETEPSTTSSTKTSTRTSTTTDPTTSTVTSTGSSSTGTGTTITDPGSTVTGGVSGASTSTTPTASGGVSSTPNTGADTGFVAGFALLFGGSAVLYGSTRLRRRGLED